MNGNSLTNRNVRMAIAWHLLAFVSIRGRSRGFANFRDMFLKFVETHIRNIFATYSEAVANHSDQWQRICSDSETFVKNR